MIETFYTCEFSWLDVNEGRWKRHYDEFESYDSALSYAEKSVSVVSFMTNVFEAKYKIYENTRKLLKAEDIR